jgi:hypothetical protein
MQKRTIFIIALLNNLKDVYAELKELSSKIESSSDNFFEKLFKSSTVEIQGDIDSYKHNIEKMKSLNVEITSKVNEWYDFIKDISQVKKVTFPIKLHFKKKSFKKLISNMNQDLLDISVENRFIREKIINWEQELSVRALQEIKKSGEFSKYEALNREKDRLISELKYLLVTIPDIEPVEFELDSIDKMIAKLMKIAAA